MEEVDLHTGVPQLPWLIAISADVSYIFFFERSWLCVLSSIFFFKLSVNTRCFTLLLKPADWKQDKFGQFVPVLDLVSIWA